MNFSISKTNFEVEKMDFETSKFIFQVGKTSFEAAKTYSVWLRTVRPVAVRVPLSVNEPVPPKTT